MADPQNISDLLVRIEATTAGLRRELDKGASSVDQFAKAAGGKVSSVEKVFDSLGISSAKAGAAITTAVGGISAAIASASAAAGAITVAVAKNAREIQNLSSVANASTTEFQRYAAGAKAVGIEQEKFADILKDVNDRIGEFNTTGSGQMKDFFTTIAPKVGVTAEQFKKLSGPQALQLYYDSLEKAGLSQQAMTFYLESMGDEATALIPLLRNGGAGFKAFGDEAERFGGILDDKAIRSSQELNAAFYLMEQSSQGLKNQFASAMLPVFIELSEVMLEAGTKSVETVGFFDILTKSVRVLAASAVGAVASFELVGKSIGGLVAIQEAATDGAAWYEKILPPFLAKRVYDNWDKTKSALNVVGDDLEATVEEKAKVLQKIWDVGEVDSTSGIKEKVKTLAAFMNEARSSTQGVTIAQEQQAKAHKSSTSAIDQQKKALEELIEKSKIAFDAAQGLANGYLAGKDLLYQYTLQQKVEQELLKTGAAAREKVTAAIQAQMDAEARQDVAKGIYQLRLETDSLNAQALATLQGTDALNAYNAEKAVAAALAGKNADALSAETKLMLEAVQANQQAAKTAEQVGKVQSIMDRLKPESALLRQYTEDQDALNKAMQLNPEHSAEYADALKVLGLEYEQNRAAATAWGQFTEGAIDRVDDAFADAWKNIGKGFDGFATSLKDGFKQLLAELAHMAITKPIIMQLGAALGVGGLSASQNSGGIGNMLSSLTGNGGGGNGIGNLLSYGQSAYKFLSGTGSELYSAFQSGGLQGVYNYGANAVGSAFGSASANSAAAGASQAGYTGSQFSNWSAAQSAGSATWGGAATSIGAIGAGITGAYAGYQNAGWKGAIAGGVGGWGGATLGTMAGAAAAAALSGTAIGATLGSIIPGIGTIIGAALGAAFGSKLFGGAWETKDTGIALGVTGGDLDANSYQFQKKKGGLFSKNKKRTLYGELPDQQAALLQGTYDTTESAVEELFTRLGITMNDGVLDGLNVGRTQISTEGKTDEQIQEEITKWFAGVADSMTSAIDAATGAGIGYNFEDLRNFVNNLYSVNDAIRYLNVGMYDASVAGGRLAESLAATAGGLQALQQSTATYFDQFFSDTEKANATLDSVTRAFQSADTVLPETREGFRKAVEALDLTTDAGQSMFATLMALAGQADSYYDILEQRSQTLSQAIAQAQSNMLSGALGALQRAVQKQQNALSEAYNARTEALNASLSSSQSAVSSLTSMTNSLSSALKTMLGQSDQATRVLYGQATATLETAAAIARAGGSLANFQGLDDALSTVTGNNSSGYGDWLSFARDQGRSAALIGELSATAGDQLTSAEKTVKGIQDQLDLSKKQFDLESKMLQGQLDLAQAQIDAINGVDNTLLSMVDALNQFAAAVLTASPNGTGGKNADTLIEAAYQSVLGRSADKAGAAYWKDKLVSGQLSSNDLRSAIGQAGAANGESINTAYQNILGRAPDAAGLAYWQQQVAAGNISDINAAIRAAAMANGQIPAFAAGGLYGGGLALVGEKGPELINFNKPGYVHTAADTASMMGGGSNAALLAEVRGLRQQTADMRAALSDIAKHTNGTHAAVVQQNESGVVIAGTVKTQAVPA